MVREGIIHYHSEIVRLVSHLSLRAPWDLEDHLARLDHL